MKIYLHTSIYTYIAWIFTFRQVGLEIIRVGFHIPPVSSTQTHTFTYTYVQILATNPRVLTCASYVHMYILYPVERLYIYLHISPFNSALQSQLALDRLMHTFQIHPVRLTLRKPCQIIQFNAHLTKQSRS